MNQKNLFKTFLFLSVFTFIGLMIMGVTGNAGDESKGKAESVKQSTHDLETMMEKYKEFATPNENHKVLDTLVGNWDHTVKWWMSPDSEPALSNGTSEIKWIMGGRFIKHTAEGTSMGQPFEGMGILGYDNEKKKYQSVWIDTMGTGIVRGGGNYDPTTMTISEEGTFSCPLEGDKSYRGVTKITDKDNFTYEWYMAGPDGNEFRAMEITYTRKM